MNRLLKEIDLHLQLIGVNLTTFASFVTGIPAYYRDYRQLKSQMKTNPDFVFGRYSPVLNERSTEAGIMKGNYFHQDILVARKIYENKPCRHIDIGSRIDGFVAHVAVFREIEILDIRPQESMVKNVIFKQADLMELQRDLSECCDSVSSLHAIEHFGLGRYGDPIDVDGHIKAIDNIHSMLKPGGIFYFSVPIGRQRIEFNAQRVFSVSYLIRILDGKFLVKNFNYVDDEGNLFENAILTKDAIDSNFNCNYYGCGIFELEKI